MTPLLLSAGCSELGLIDGAGLAVKTGCWGEIRPDKHGLGRLTNQECLAILHFPPAG